MLSNKMELPRLFFNEKEKVYVYVDYNDNIICNVCDKEINSSLIYHVAWLKKKKSQVKLYHISCLESVSTRGFADEFKTCVLAKEVPKDALPVFERQPSFSHKGGLNTFQVSEICKNSEAEIKDRTRIARNPNQSIMPEYERNVLMFKKREEELGHSLFIWDDILADNRKQLRQEQKDDKNMSPQEVVNDIVNRDNKAKKSEIKLKRELFYKNEIIPPEMKTSIFIEEFYSVVKESKLLLPGQEERELLSDSSGSYRS